MRIFKWKTIVEMEDESMFGLFKQKRSYSLQDFRERLQDAQSERTTEDLSNRTKLSGILKSLNASLGKQIKTEIHEDLGVVTVSVADFEYGYSIATIDGFFGICDSICQYYLHPSSSGEELATVFSSDELVKWMQDRLIEDVKKGCIKVTQLTSTEGSKYDGGHQNAIARGIGEIERETDGGS